MKRTLVLLLLAISLIALLNCSGSKQTGAEPAVLISDETDRGRVDDLKAQIKKDPDNPGLRRELAEIYYENGNKLEAMRELESGLSTDPNDAESLFLYAQIAESAGDQKKALLHYKKVLETSAGSAYLDRISPKFMDAFETSPLISGTGHQAAGSYSPDGTKIIFQTNEYGNWDIAEYEIASGVKRLLIQTPGNEESPSYLGSSDHIVYTSTRDDHRGVEYTMQLREIYTQDIKTGIAKNLTTNGSDDWAPRPSADGRFICFTSERNDSREVLYYEYFSDVFLMEKDGRFQLTLTHTENNDGNPCIAPESTEHNGRIYFDSNREGRYDIYRMDFRGEKLTRLTFNPGADDIQPVVSPNGDKIVFSSNRNGNFDLFMMNSDGTAEQRLTSNPANDSDAEFSPDGSKIIFHSERNGNYDIFEIDLSRQISEAAPADVIAEIDKALENL